MRPCARQNPAANRRNCGVRPESAARESPKNRRMAPSGFPPRQIFGDYGAGLLIVPPLFFIQRRDGEVAEWSKALPC